jgi:FlaA1/EpsC-like NDP-sugar epimerase
LLGISAKIVPTVEDILERKVNALSFRNVEMNDLLGRKPIEPYIDDQGLAMAYAGKRILITGAGGSIGSELAEQISRSNRAHCCFSIKMKMGSTTPTRAWISLREPKRLR